MWRSTYFSCRYCWSYPILSVRRLLCTTDRSSNPLGYSTWYLTYGVSAEIFAYSTAGRDQRSFTGRKLSRLKYNKIRDGRGGGACSLLATSWRGQRTWKVFTLGQVSSRHVIERTDHVCASRRTGRWSRSKANGKAWGKGKGKAPQATRSEWGKQRTTDVVNVGAAFTLCSSL